MLEQLFEILRRGLVVLTSAPLRSSGEIELKGEDAAAGEEARRSHEGAVLHELDERDSDLFSREDRHPHDPGQGPDRGQVGPDRRPQRRGRSVRSSSVR